MKNIVFSILGTNLDCRGYNESRWKSWRPTVSLFQHDTIHFDRLELLYQSTHEGLAKLTKKDIESLSPTTEVILHEVDFGKPWDFETVYSKLLDFTKAYKFDVETEDYYYHITTGTHVSQICAYLLTESRYLPGKLIQTSPVDEERYQIIDLDLSKYDLIASRFKKEHLEGADLLKSGIKTKNAAFNKMIEQLEKVSLKSNDPILLLGETGVGKSQLAKQIYDLKKQRGKLKGNFISVNCATLRGDKAMSTLFGHVKGAFTGAIAHRNGLLMEANNGMIMLDEIGELGLEEQAMLLCAIETKRFTPIGSDKEVSSNFQIIAGTNKDLQKGDFREDLLARINLWSYTIPALRDRAEDIEPNIEYELEKLTDNTLVSFNKDAREIYVKFAKQADWRANFRDLNASMKRMSVLSDGGRITIDVVNHEIKRLSAQWKPQAIYNDVIDLKKYTDQEIDLFDQHQLAQVIKVCQQSKNAAEAGRLLFSESRKDKKSVNDSHRLGQYLKKFGLYFDTLNNGI